MPKKDNDLSENTIIIFTSDHGDCLTDHGHSQKWTMFEKITRVPLIFSGVGIQKNRKLKSWFNGWMLVQQFLIWHNDSPSGMEALSMLPAVMGDHGKAEIMYSANRWATWFFTDANS